MAQRDDLPTLDVASRGTKFVDNEGRTLTLRGVNLGGAKLPAGYRSDESDKVIKAPTEIFIPEVVQYPEGFVVELSDGDYKLERAPDAVGGYCILRYTPGPPGYVSIVVVKRVGADDQSGRGCCVQSAADEKLLPSKPSSVVDFAEEASPADPAAGA